MALDGDDLRIIEVLNERYNMLSRRVESLMSQVEALIRLLPPERLIEYGRLRAEIHAQASKAADEAESRIDMSRKLPGGDDPSRGH